MSQTFAEIIFPQRLTQSFTYRVPVSWLDTLKVGDWVVSPFGRTARPGFVVSISEAPADSTVPVDRIRELDEHLTSSSDFDLDPTLIALAEWMADYYIAPLGFCFQLIQPPRLPFKTASRLRSTSLGAEALARGRLSEPAKILLGLLNQKPKGLTLPTLKKTLATASGTVTQLKRQKWVEEIHTYTVLPTVDGSMKKTKEKASTSSKDVSGQEIDSIAHPTWWTDFQRHLTEHSFEEYFIDEVGTDSSSILIRSLEDTLKNKRTALIIVPDINQAISCADTLRKDFGEQVGLFHSGLSDPIRMKEWQKIKQRRYQIVVGTRVSVFIPIPSLGLIWLRQEEDSTFKDEQAPYYHARDVARERARLSNATLFLESSHPSLETFHHFSISNNSDNKTTLNTTNPEDSIQMVDHLQMPYGTTISDEMRHGIEQSLAAGGGIIIFHNRKGFSYSIACRDCGMAAQCKPCQVPYGLLTAPPKLRCPYCGNVKPVPLTCPGCEGSHLEPSGFGTERLEQELHREFPDAPIGRFDRNSIRTESEAQSIRDRFTKGAIQILIGTEMLFHGTPLTPVRFVGIPYADAGLHRPDFRSAEQLYHHLQSAIHLVTDHELAHPVVLQTRLPSHHVMHAVATQQPTFFYENELAFREAVGYPPLIHFIQMTVTGSNQALVQEAAGEWATTLASQIVPHSPKQPPNLMATTSILGPIASHALKHRRLHRETILFKAIDVDQARTAIRQTYQTMAGNKKFKGLKFGINVDPMDMQ